MDSKHRARRSLADSARRVRLHRSQATAVLLALCTRRRRDGGHRRRGSRARCVGCGWHPARSRSVRMDRRQRRRVRGMARLSLHARHLRLRVARDRSADRHATHVSAIYPPLEAPTSSGFTRRIFVGAMLGLGILTKGPVAIVLCALAVTIFLLIERRNPVAMLRERWPWQVVAIAVAIGALWYVPATIVGGHKIVRIIFAENFGHFMPARLGGTGESYRPFYYIATRLIGSALPMTLLILPAVLAFYTSEIAPEKRQAVIYQISMSVAVLLFFSLASVKRDDYILPALPGIAILCSSVFTLNFRCAASKLRDLVVALFVVSPILLFVLLLLVPLHTHANLQSSDAAYSSILQAELREHRGGVVGVALIWIVGLGVAIFALIRRNAVASAAAFGAVAVGFSLFWTATLRPAVAQARSLKSFVPIVADHVKADQLCIPSGINYELSYYYGSAVPDLTNQKCAYLITTPRELDAMTPEYRARLKPVAKSNLIGGGGPPP